MGNLLYYIATGLIIVWLVGHFGYHVPYIHAVIILAFLLVVIRVIIGKRAV